MEVGWRERPPEGTVRALRVVVESIQILNNHAVSGFIPFRRRGLASWRLWIGMSGERRVVPGLHDIHDGQVIPFAFSEDVYVPAGAALQITSTGWVVGSIDGVLGVQPSGNARGSPPCRAWARLAY